MPSSLDADGRQRMVGLQHYLDRLMEVEAVRRSEPLLLFLSADKEPTRRSLWQAAVGTTQFAGEAAS